MKYFISVKAIIAGFLGFLIGFQTLSAYSQDFGLNVLGRLTPEDYERGEVRDLKIGMAFTEILPQFYFEFACGSNGGPPFKALGGFMDYMDCAPEAVTGLREVYVRYDDQNEFVVRLYRELQGEQLWLERFTGTKVGGHPVLLSVLFNEEGIIKGIRVVTDPRVSIDERRFAHLLRNQILIRYGRGGWQCEDLDALPGENPLGGIFIKQDCEKLFPDEKKIHIMTKLLRKPGQDGLDDLGNYKPGDFESSTRFEIFSPEINFR